MTTYTFESAERAYRDDPAFRQMVAARGATGTAALLYDVARERISAAWAKLEEEAAKLASEPFDPEPKRQEG